MSGDSSPSPICLYAVNKEKLPYKSLFSDGSLVLNIEEVCEMLALAVL
jgi:hypothetical protein